MRYNADTAECFAHKFSSNSILESSEVSLPDFLLRTESLLCDSQITEGGPVP